jgi:sigma-B regulation protein RsbU (phosphoserine phosphatase)
MNATFTRFEAWLRRFWARVSDGLELHELWSHFWSEARSGYRLYSRDVNAGPRPQGALATVSGFFWAILTKLAPARRVVLLIALVFLFMPSIEYDMPHKRFEATGFPFFGGVILFMLLVLEVADRVTMKRDLQIAREIQLWLVPTETPDLPGLDVVWMNRPQNTVAGDYYDAFVRETVAGPRVLLVVADVAGKSIPAALLMATFQASLKTLCATPCSLLELVNGLNRYSCAHSSDGRRFTTAFFAEFDPATGELEYINAGHNLPLLREASGNIVKLQEGGLPIGIVERTPYSMGRRILAPGDLLLVYTDGLVEAENAREEQFGEARTIAWISSESAADVKASLDRLTNQLQGFVGTTVQADDITCLLIRRRS